MSRYHINPESGEPGPCSAKIQCRFKDSPHFETIVEAQKHYEETMKDKTLPAKVTPYDHYSFEEFSAIEAEMLETLKTEQREITDREYDRHREFIRRVNHTYESTHKANTHKVKGKMVYTDERLALHDEIVEDLNKRYADVPTDGKCIMSGGVAGSGKTTTLRNNTGINVDEYASINPDDIKYLMAEKGMITKIKGLQTMEADELIQYESLVITKKLYERMSSQRKNLLIDKTMVNSNPVKKDVADLRKKGYVSFDAVFVDVPIDTSYERIVQRHRDGINRVAKNPDDLGERCTPGSALKAAWTDDEKHNSKNALTLIELADEGIFTSKPRIFDTSGKAKELSFDSFKENGNKKK